MSGTEAVLPYLPSLCGQVQLDHFTGTVSCIEIEYIRFHLNSVCYISWTQ
jgi:hypothetical protein